jgi:hypothetical protein
MVTVNAPFHKHLENEAKMHFTCTSAVLALPGKCSAHSNSPLKDLVKLYF